MDAEHDAAQWLGVCIAMEVRPSEEIAGQNTKSPPRALYDSFILNTPISLF